MFLFPTKQEDCPFSKLNYVVPQLHQTSILLLSQKPRTDFQVPILVSLFNEPQKWLSKNPLRSIFKGKNKPRNLVQMKIWIWKIPFLKSLVNISKRQWHMLDEVLVKVI